MNKEHEPSRSAFDVLRLHAGVVAPCYDERAGDGFQATVQQETSGRSVEVAFFPDTGLARVKTRLAELTIRQARVSYREGVETEDPDGPLTIRGEVENEWAMIDVFRDGGLVFTSQPIEHEDEGREDGRLPEESAEHGEERKERNERVTIAGRVGKDPWFKTGKNGKLVGKFPLSERTPEGKTTWHRVAVFGEQALKVQDRLHKGDEIEVVAYPTTIEWTDEKSGEAKSRLEMQAAVVRRPKSTS